MVESLEGMLSQRYPGELPSESEPGYWWDVVRHEQATRDAVSGWLRQLLRDREEPRPLSDLESCFVRRRIEWAVQLICGYSKRGMEPELHGTDLLQFLLVDTWESDGHEGLWNQAERDGRPPPTL